MDASQAGKSDASHLISRKRSHDGHPVVASSHEGAQSVQFPLHKDRQKGRDKPKMSCYLRGQESKNKKPSFKAT